MEYSAFKLSHKLVWVIVIGDMDSRLFREFSPLPLGRSR
jgi:hypothetical protein